MRANHAAPRGVRRQDRVVRLGPTELELVLHQSVAPHQLDDVPVVLYVYIYIYIYIYIYMYIR